MIASLSDIEALEAQARPHAGSPSTYSLIRDSAQRHPDAPALSFFLRVEDHATPVRWTYRQWLSDITRLANALHRLGVGRGDVVAFVTGNFPETQLTLWAAETAGICLAINPLLEGAQIGELLLAAQARWVVVADPMADAETWKRVGAGLAKAGGVQGVLAFDALRHLPAALRPPQMPLPTELSGVPVFDFWAEVAKENGEALNFEGPQAQDIASYFCTGGTTGLPKIAQHTQANEIALADQIFLAAGESMCVPGRTMLVALPLFHVNAALGTGLSVFAGGGHILLAPPAGFRAPGLIARFWEVVQAHKVSAFSGVPTVFAGLLQAPRAGCDLSSLTAAICGAAPLPVELFRSFEAQTGLRILEGYGLTEGTCVSSLNPLDGESRIGSIGLRLPWQPMRAMILDAQGQFQREAGADEVGSICISGSNVFPGYLNPDHNQGNWFETVQADGSSRRWFNTGDLGRMDSEGYFWLTGRKKELIIRGGHNIDPKLIEEALAAHPAVAMCAAVGRPDAHAGELPVAYVQLQPGAQVSEEELLAFAGARIHEAAARPKAILIVDALPLTAVGKIFKPTLSLREIAAVVRAEAASAGLVLSQLVVEQDAKRGLLASYQIAPAQTDAATAFRQALGRYAFHSQELSES